jgi:type I restriction enzyme, S subunit
LTLQLRRVGDILQLQRRKVDVETTQEYAELGLRSFGKGIFHKEPITGAELGNKRVFYIEPGDLLFSNVFAWEGAVAVATEEERGFIGSHRFLTYVPTTSDTDANYLRYFFLSERGLALLGQASPGSAGRNRTLAIERFEALEIPLPSFDEQRRIASLLDSVVARQGLAEALLVRQQRVMAAYVASKASQGGKIRQVGDMVTQVKRPVSVEPQARYRLVGIRSAGQGLFAKNEIAGSETTAKTLYRIEEGDFMYSRLFAWQGSFALASSEFDGCVASNEFPMFQVDPSIVLSDYLRAWFRRPQTWRQVEARSSGSTPQSRNRLREDRFLQLEIAIPDMKKQHNVADALFAADRFQDLRRTTWSRVSALSSATIHSAFSGAGE